MTRPDDLPDGLARSHRAWIEAVNETDLGAYAEAVCEDLVWLPPGQPPVEGRAAFRDWLAPFFDRYAYDFTIEDPVFRVAEGRAVEKARFRSRMSPRAGADPMEHAGRFIALWRRDGDGRWRIERYVDDTVTPPGRAAVSGVLPEGGAFSKSAHLYDLIYGAFKDYAEESRGIAELLERHHPEARSVLDVACGTGEHARLLAREHGYAVDGVDLEPEFVRRAEEKSPEGRFAVADMTDFDLGRRYDAVLCLFSSIGYLRSLEAVERALRRFRAHLAPGGIVVLEPWIEPDAWREGSVFTHTAESGDVSVCRMSHAARRERLSVLTFHYLVGRGRGIEHFTETHEMGLFTREELEGAFAAAGLEVVEYDPEGPIGRGLFVARKS